MDQFLGSTSLANGAEIKAVSTKHRTPLHSSVICGDYYINGAKVTAMRVTVVELLILRGVDVNAVDDEGKTALWFAKENDLHEIVDLLRLHGA